MADVPSQQTSEYQLVRQTLWILAGLGVIGIGSMTFLIYIKADGNAIAVLAGSVGVVVGGLCGFLRHPRTPQQPGDDPTK